jgi:CheY-like chemotaxis protein
MTHDASVTNPPGSASVLIVEDEQGVRETTAAILRREGYRVSQAADGVEAMAILKDGGIDVLILDLRLPRMNGTALIEALEQPPTTVVFSAFEYFDEDEMRARYGPVIFECLRKPVTPVRLITVVAAAADQARHGGSDPA